MAEARRERRIVVTADLTHPHRTADACLSRPIRERTGPTGMDTGLHGTADIYLDNLQVGGVTMDFNG
jgi:hypothetical protein